MNLINQSINQTRNSLYIWHFVWISNPSTSTFFSNVKHAVFESKGKNSQLINASSCGTSIKRARNFSSRWNFFRPLTIRISSQKSRGKWSVSLSRRVLRRPERGTMPNDDGEDNNGPPTQTAWSWCDIVGLAGSFIRRRRKIVALATQTHGAISRLYPDKPLYEHMKNMSYAVHVVHMRYMYSIHWYRMRNLGHLPNFFISGFRRVAWHRETHVGPFYRRMIYSGAWRTTKDVIIPCDESW